MNKQSLINIANLFIEIWRLISLEIVSRIEVGESSIIVDIEFFALLHVSEGVVEYSVPALVREQDTLDIDLLVVLDVAVVDTQKVLRNIGVSDRDHV